MYPEERVLVVYVSRPADWRRIVEAGWYRIPAARAPKGLHAEIYAFYLGRRFGADKWSIAHYARQSGHELVRRIDLLPDEPAHPRAQAAYYKIQLGPLQKRPQPIVSLRWRRITFIHTTWDRFEAAQEIGDLFVEGDAFVDRQAAILRERSG